MLKQYKLELLLSSPKKYGKKDMIQTVKGSSIFQVAVWENNLSGLLFELYERCKDMCMKHEKKRFVSIHDQIMISIKTNRTQENIQNKPVKLCDDTDTDLSLSDT